MFPSNSPPQSLYTSERGELVRTLSYRPNSKQICLWKKTELK
jgi:hypothetical protein